MLATPTNTTVLLVDDRPCMRKGIRSVLEDYEDVQVVGEASDGIKAIQYARLLRPHVVLMDISVPEMDGMQATRVIKQEDSETIIIGLGLVETSIMPQALADAGFAAYLNKESIGEDLYPTIARCLDCSSLPGLPTKQPWTLRNR
jgi:DNA-binding NarL/FixJ family response regulator